MVVPAPRRALTRPAASSSASARRTVPGATPTSPASCLTVGRRAPAVICPEAMAKAIWRRTCSQGGVVGGGVGPVARSASHLLAGRCGVVSVQAHRLAHRSTLPPAGTKTPTKLTRPPESAVSPSTPTRNDAGPQSWALHVALVSSLETATANISPGWSPRRTRPRPARCRRSVDATHVQLTDGRVGVAPGPAGDGDERTGDHHRRDHDTHGDGDRVVRAREGVPLGVANVGETTCPPWPRSVSSHE